MNPSTAFTSANEPAATRQRIYLSPPDMSDVERNALLRAFDSGWVAPVGPELDAFEAEFANFVGVQHAVAVSSGTAALHLALCALGVGPGDHVVTSTLTFVATANAIRYTGANPVFIDSEPQSWNLDPDLLADELRTRQAAGQQAAAVIAVDVFGQCADYNLIRQICTDYHVPLIEDAAESLGARYHGEMAGTFGEIGCFSFNGNKIITASSGGMIVTDHKSHADRIRYLATQAREPALHYEHCEIGFNYRMSNLLAAIGRGQLSRLETFVAKRRANFQYYRSHLSDLPGIQFMPQPDGSESNRWLTCALINESELAASRNDLIEALEEQQMESRPVWKPMHLQPAYRAFPVRGGAVSESLFRNGICLPSGSSLTDGELDRIIEVVRRVAQR